MTMTGGIDDLRRRHLRATAFLLWPAIALAAFASRHDLVDMAVATVLGAMVSILPTMRVLAGRFDRVTRLQMGVAAAVFPALFIYIFRGHPWQDDLHMYYFVCLVGLALLCDVWPIIVASALIIAQHLLLGLPKPDWVFGEDFSLSLLVLHGGAVVGACWALCYLTNSLRELLEAAERARIEATAAEDGANILAERAEAAKRVAEDALATASAAERRALVERHRAQEIESRAADERHRDMVALAATFEGSVQRIVQSVGSAASQLQSTAASLDALATENRRQSADVVCRAADASLAARELAGGVTTLSRSINGIASRVEQQDELGSQARALSRTGDAAIGTLSARAMDIGDFTGRIQAIASQTKLLALNATIEAARAGEAGRGFAVVAQEVKSLAAQSATATVEIGGLVDTTLGSATVAEASLRDMASSVEELSDAAAAIRTLLEEQRRAADAIRESASEAAGGAERMADHVGRVAEVASQAGILSGQVQDAASDLVVHASELRTATARFIGSLRQPPRTTAAAPILLKSAA